jgi:hypothetical protein
MFAVRRVVEIEEQSRAEQNTAEKEKKKEKEKINK